MAKAKVWNDNKHDLTDTWRGKEIFIKAGEHVIMDYEEADLYKKNYKAPMFNVDGGHDPRGFKMVRVEEIKAPKPEAEVSKDYLCQACGYNGLSKWDLEGHINELHLDTMADTKEAEKRKAKKGK